MEKLAYCIGRILQEEILLSHHPHILYQHANTLHGIYFRRNYKTSSNLFAVGTLLIGQIQNLSQCGSYLSGSTSFTPSTMQYSSCTLPPVKSTGSTIIQSGRTFGRR